jgi:S-adenosylmethionine:tRNA ribosyltransferase-isomerase
MLIDTTKIFINDYIYELPEERIAKYPAEERDKSKLLIYKNGDIQQNSFNNISEYLPSDSCLVFNNTKVIPARIIFKKESGAQIEVFCLEPVLPSNDFSLILQQKGECVWNCLVGNLKKWKEGILTKEIIINGERVIISIEKINKEQEDNKHLIKFSWTPRELMFSEIIENAGLVPLPPYINRDADETDKETYQTIYAKIKGSVAAPTAGLHFTDDVINKITSRGIKTEYVTLHVSSGTFLPVSAQTLDKHQMHSEVISVNTETIENILSSINKPIISVGTTSLRTIESLYWFGVKLITENIKERTDIYPEIEQWDPYKEKYNKGITKEESIKAISLYMKQNKLNTITGTTRIIIVPGYKFRMTDGLITNFHQPKSTLLLLIAAFIGDDWKRVYDYALNNDFRFLSYGDSSILYSRK